ncbi:9266_t:CDS:2 [Cetraspora pellucida]|uniref:9266_t:CDS:1 n=1 Tax=Cetraspora pellucida TaxID=1433469 RepID=A0A9N9EAB8_9GLOM|nr:9266_t:CDS:2 [Cetraspora pellucida]
MCIIYLTICSLHNALLKEFLDEDTMDEIDLDMTNDINIFDEKSEDKELEQIKSPAEHIKKIMSKLFIKYYKFSNDRILFTATAIDPRCKNFKFEGATLKYQDYLRLEYDQIISDKSFGSSLNKVAFDLSGSFISTVFMVVQQKVTHKNEVDQYLMMKTIGPLKNLLQW